MGTKLVYRRAAARPALELWLQDDDGNLIDFSTGYTFSFKLGQLGAAAVFTKTTGIAGAAGSGTAPSGTPNITVTFTAGELSAIPARTYTWQVTATSGGLPRMFDGDFVLRDVIT